MKIAVVNKHLYRFNTKRHNHKDYIVVEQIEPQGDTVRVLERCYVRQPHPAYSNGQWRPKHFEKLVKSGEVMRQRAQGWAKR